jgi:hypothetical protein
MFAHPASDFTPSRHACVEIWEAVADPVLDRCCAIGIIGSFSPPPPQFSAEGLLTVTGINVVSPQHPLATTCADSDARPCGAYPAHACG